MTELKPTKYARLGLPNGELLIRKDRIISIEVSDFTPIGKDRSAGVYVHVWVQQDDTHSYRHETGIISQETYDAFLKEVYDD